MRRSLQTKPEGEMPIRGTSIALDLAHRIMGLSAWASTEVTPVTHMSFGFMFLYCIAYERLADQNPGAYGCQGVCSQTIHQRVNDDIRNLAKLKHQDGKPVSHDAAKGIKVF